jgi:CheY-like chemotaxis protein
MQEVTESRTIGIGLDSTIRSQRVSNAIECLVQYITEDCTDAIAIVPDERFHTGEDVELRMFVPLERSPIKCTGRIVWHSEGEEFIKGRSGYSTRIFINHISRVDRRRLELAIAQKRAFIGCGRRFDLREPAVTATVEAAVQLGSEHDLKRDIGDSAALVAEIESLRRSIAELENTLKQQTRKTSQARKLGVYNVLVVDDERANLNALERTLRREYKVFSATNGEDALSIMERNDIDLIIADHRMPGMTGVEFLEKTLEKHPDTIRTILTAYTDESLLMDAINRAHVHRYVSKPWEPEEITAIVREGIGVYETASASGEPNTQPTLETGIASRAQFKGALQFQKKLDRQI